MIGRSSITCVVVSRIVERMGLKPVSHPPELAASLLVLPLPGLVILDGGLDNRDCDGLLTPLLAARGNADLSPAVILLSSHNTMRLEGLLKRVVDAVVSKPITPERLQTAIRALPAHDAA